ncbi:MAG: recombinase RecA [Candidatus Staskawiczbacteria bacterium RIFOXYC1_FULL_37_43]|nr:MAG: recombinase RecA [Candidatus Staskawiczbacteria bacterium RIFCSPHIGHO2_01_FULL_37_17]OGZ71748.1 MAG: recombinase RecA [Candidatus Staskawiczbacteria bacterium RIFCSPLOWO2_01_FULL_37_19]OGZ75916.1 MAG: recombinase RecA [Candidatus Staskawiczbacteria bacterium RIFOXYA1_FULL_37_15]OGZ76888.1 MAG: recombinase RecA [Candidatus Staskawiczbacteria bacterium RIFOXYA12_FULL_37_10]OGZ80804.1 MAG: recombinase RecA [Candidatus Staskawiczbacteria bacterium RIFOXYB1_FULL_38_37]OGZ82560.1 MAG: recomb
MAKDKKDKLEIKKENKAIQNAVDEIKERFGEGAIMTMREIHAVNVDVVPTGSIAMDMALGVGGMPRGRIIEIYGTESSGKTTLSLHIIAEAQKKGGTCAFIDAEHAMDPDYAKRIGVDVDNLLISQPDSGEQALQIVETLVKSGNIDVIVVDSVAALTPQREIEGEIGDQHMGLQARLMSQACRKLSGIMAKSNTMVIFLNQTRMKIGMVFGNPETTPGGLALKFYASVRINLTRTAQIKSGDEIIGNRVKVKVVKNKVAAPFRTAEFDIYYNEGISKSGDALRAGLTTGLIKQSGSFFTFEGEKIGQGTEAAKAYLKEHKEAMEKIKKLSFEQA